MNTFENNSKPAKNFVPSFDELAIFCVSYSVIFLFVINDVFRSEFSSYLLTNIIGILLLIMIIIGMAFSVFHVLSSRKKTPIEKRFMLFFIVFMNLTAGFFGFFYVVFDAVRASDFYSLIFPIWNFSYALYLAALMRLHKLDETAIRDENAPFYCTIFSVVLISVILLICQFYFQLYWIFSFSIALFYVSIFNQFLIGLVKTVKHVKPS